MRIARTITLLLLCFVLLFSVTSCATFVHHDNGKHKGWYKNTHNPHNPNTTNPGKAKGKGHK